MLTRCRTIVPTLLALAGAACSSSSGQDPDDPTVAAQRAADGTIVNDRSLCLEGPPQSNKGLEVSETAGPGTVQPNIRRVWKVLGTGADRRTVIVCREVDTNLDGVKDVVRLYNAEGQSREERADTNYDGKIDTWNVFSKGRLAEVRLDKNFDTEPDEWKVYYEGKLSRVKRDTNFDKKADVWEMYKNERLERMGVDLDGDERVDRWDHDADFRRQLEQAEDKKRREQEKKKREEREENEKEGADAADEMEEARSTTK